MTDEVVHEYDEGDAAAEQASAARGDVPEREGGVPETEAENAEDANAE